jgi:hypothetical protein
MSEQEPATWQELLGRLITNPQERAHLATAVRVNPITLQRWTRGTSRPRIENIRMLIQNVPKDAYSPLMHLLVNDFPELLRDDVSEKCASQEIPVKFYAHALSNLALTPRLFYRQSMQDLVLQQALRHLDPDQQGLSITLAVCVSPRREHKVRSLREVGGLATPPWSRTQEERPMFLGSESLVGYAVTHGHACVINSRKEKTLLSVQWTEYEESAAAFPILLHARIVGGLIVSSAHEHFFTQPRLAAIENYAHLAACIFELEESFDFNEIALGIMPPYVSQRPYFVGYNQRVFQKLVEANAAGQQITMEQARQVVWQDLEDVLLQISPD